MRNAQTFFVLISGFTSFYISHRGVPAKMWIYNKQIHVIAQQKTEKEITTFI